MNSRKNSGPSHVYFSGDGAGNILSLILGGVLVTMGLATFICGLLSDLISQHRHLNEIALEKIREMERGEVTAGAYCNKIPEESGG